MTNKPIEEKEIRGLNVGTARTYLTGIIIVVLSIAGSFYGITNSQTRMEGKINEIKVQVESNTKINSIQIDALSLEIKRIDIEVKQLESRFNEHLNKR